jgi:hypothetical protein
VAHLDPRRATPRDRFRIGPSQTRHFYDMPGWWRILVLLGAALTGLGIGQCQDRWFPGALVLFAGLGLTASMTWLWWRARRNR